MAAVIAAAVFTGCSKPADNPVPSTTGEIGATENSSAGADSPGAGVSGSSADNEENNTATTEQILSAALKVSEIPSVVVKDKSELGDYYDFPAKDVVSASFALCGSGAFPDEAAVFEVVTDKNGMPTADVLNEVTQSVLRRIEKRTEEFSTYTPDEMYKLEESNLAAYGKKYIIYTALKDNDGSFKAATDYIDSLEAAN